VSKLSVPRNMTTSTFSKTLCSMQACMLAARQPHSAARLRQHPPSLTAPDPRPARCLASFQPCRKGGTCIQSYPAFFCVILWREACHLAPNPTSAAAAALHVHMHPPLRCSECADSLLLPHTWNSLTAACARSVLRYCPGARARRCPCAWPSLPPALAQPRPRLPPSRHSLWLHPPLRCCPPAHHAARRSRLLHREQRSSCRRLPLLQQQPLRRARLLPWPAMQRRHLRTESPHAGVLECTDAQEMAAGPQSFPCSSKQAAEGPGAGLWASCSSVSCPLKATAC
jgi:hypothetical protein